MIIIARKPKYPNTSKKQYLAWVEKAMGRKITDDELVKFKEFYESAQFGPSRGEAE